MKSRAEKVRFFEANVIPKKRFSNQAAYSRFMYICVSLCIFQFLMYVCRLKEMSRLRHRAVRTGLWFSQKNSFINPVLSA